MDNDDWEEHTGAQGGARDPLVQSEWNRLATRYSDAGYREGITDGKLSTLQQGFDQGFNGSVALSRRLGRLRGRANGLLAHLLKVEPGQVDTVASLREFIRLLGSVKRGNVLPVDVERQAHEREEHEEFELDRNDRRDMEGLESAMGGVVSGGQVPLAREGELLHDLEQRLGQLEQSVKSLLAKSPANNH